MEKLSESSSKPVDRVALTKAAKPMGKRDTSLRGPFLKSLMAISALTAVAGPAMAQAPPGIAPVAQEVVSTEQTLQLQNFDTSNLDLSIDSDEIIRIKELPTVASDTTKTKWGVQVNSVNDFMPDSWTSWLGSPEHKIPDGSAFDDDGWTAEIQMLSNFQKGNKETVVGARLAMVTQPGSRFPYAEDYQGLRTDLGEFVVQRNTQLKLGENTTFDYGLGGGVQTLGDIGGHDIQEWFHEVGPAGGRVGDELQSNQVNDSFRVMPLVTAGAKITYNFKDVDFILKSKASVPFGNGLGNVGLRAGVGSDWGPVNYEVGGKLDATWTDAPELAFHDPGGVRPGLYARLEYKPGKIGSFYTQLETGGIRNEPVLTFGIRIGGGSKARLSPFW